MVAVDEELGLGAAHAVRDGRRVELVVDAALALRLGVQRVAAALLGEDAQTLGRLLSQTEQHVRLVVRSPCPPTTTDIKSSSSSSSSSSSMQERSIEQLISRSFPRPDRQMSLLFFSRLTFFFLLDKTTGSDGNRVWLG